MHSIIGSYVHFNNLIGSMVILKMDTDFATRTDDAKIAVKKIAMVVCGLGTTDKNIVHNNDEIISIIKELKNKLKENVILDSVVILDAWS